MHIHTHAIPPRSHNLSDERDEREPNMDSPKTFQCAGLAETEDSRELGGCGQPRNACLICYERSMAFHTSMGDLISLSHKP